MPHGQPFVEKGVSINKEHLVVNHQEESLIALCTLNDDMFSEQLDISQYQHYNENRNKCQIFQTHYMATLEEEIKKAHLNSVKSCKRKQLT